MHVIDRHVARIVVHQPADGMGLFGPEPQIRLVGAVGAQPHLDAETLAELVGGAVRRFLRFRRSRFFFRRSRFRRTACRAPCSTLVWRRTRHV